MTDTQAAATQGVSRRELHQQLLDHIGPTLRAHDDLFPGNALTERYRMGQVDIWVTLLLTGKMDQPTARRLANAHGSQPAPQFWETKLGQMIFGAGGYPAEGIDRVMARYILGVTRQRVQQLVVDGKLAVVPGYAYLLTPESVTERWAAQRTDATAALARIDKAIHDPNTVWERRERPQRINRGGNDTR